MAQKRDLWYSNLLLVTSIMGRFGFRFTLAMGFRPNDINSNDINSNSNQKAQRDK